MVISCTVNHAISLVMTSTTGRQQCEYLLVSSLTSHCGPNSLNIHQEVPPCVVFAFLFSLVQWLSKNWGTHTRTRHGAGVWLSEARAGNTCWLTPALAVYGHFNVGKKFLHLFFLSASTSCGKVNFLKSICKIIEHS